MSRARPFHPAVAIAFGGLVAGSLDILYAMAFWWLKAGVSPLRILQSVAAGALGPASFDGGAASATLGLVLHFAIATAMAAAYVLAARRVPLLLRRPWLCGAAHGLLLYAAMNLVVVPLSAAGAQPRDPLWVACSIVAHMLLVGVPIALFARLASAGSTEPVRVEIHGS